MNENNLSARLQMVADFVPKGKVLADIGSDHGYLPVYLLKNGLIKKAICGEVVEGPYQQTVKEIEKAQLKNSVTVRLADGLEAIKKEDGVQLISICGMGGKLITDILTAGKNILTPEMDLLLQPNIHQALVREWLMENHYEIMQEEIVEDHDKTYEALYARKVSKRIPLTPQDLFFGPLLRQQKNPVFLKKWQRILASHEKILHQLKTSEKAPMEKIQQFQQELSWIKEELAC